MTTSRRLILKMAALGLAPSSVFANCRPTEPDALGPFYRRHAPYRSRLAGSDEPGQILHVSGRVAGASGCDPLHGAIVDVWHASEKGRYYDVGKDAGSDPGAFRLRGRVRTTADGEYAFSTIMPGTYGGRPKHIHYVVYHPGGEPLVTQLYFEGDPLLRSGSLAGDGLVRPVEAAPGDALRVRFDIVLAKPA